MQKIFDQLKELQQQMEKKYNDLERSLADYDATGFERQMKEEDFIYEEYHKMIMKNFSRQTLERVERKIGYGRFVEPIFLVTLQEIVESEQEASTNM